LSTLFLLAKKKYTDRFAGIAPKGHEELTDRHRKVLEFFSEYMFQRTLDVGCGDGNFSILLKKFARMKIGVK